MMAVSKREEEDKALEKEKVGERAPVYGRTDVLLGGRRHVRIFGCLM
jgi:hypothetical protein